MNEDRNITVGDLVKGTSMHNYGLVGLVVGHDPNATEEFQVHWLVGQNYISTGFYEFQERWYDMEVISQ